jgi:ABC-type transport system involved in cytochrome bd biosynthesis fused ATPase/permease subunit
MRCDDYMAKCLLGLVPQQAWVQSGTVRDNITFATDSALVDDARVKEVIKATGLQADLDMWQDGDMYGKLSKCTCSRFCADYTGP